MALSIGVAALFFGVVFVIVGWKGGGTGAMNENLAGMLKGDYLVHDNPPVSTTPPSKNSGTATTGGTYAPTPKTPGAAGSPIR